MNNWMFGFILLNLVLTVFNYIMLTGLVKFFAAKEQANLRAYQALHGAFNKDTADGFDSNTEIKGNS